MLAEAAVGATSIEPTTLGVIAVAVVTLAKVVDWALARVDRIAEERRATSAAGEGKLPPEIAALISAMGQRQDHEERIRALETQAAEDRGRRTALTTGSHPRAELDR